MAQGKDAKYAKFEVRQQSYHQHWKVSLMQTCPASPGFCCLSVWCPWCVSYHLRKRSLYNDMSRYVCCNGDLPCSGRCGEQSCPECCLCLETVLCFGQSVASTRWLLQDEMHIQNTDCDNCIIATMIAMQYLACICSIAACISGSQELNDLAQIIDLLADCLWVSVCACMQTQHKVQLDERDNNPGLVRPPVGPYVAPHQQAMPPPGAYPAAVPQYGQYTAPPPQTAPQYSYPPPQAAPQYGHPPLVPVPGGSSPQVYPPPPGYPYK